MKKHLFLLFAIPLAMATTACKKGCTDPDASNYKKENKRDDGSCEYACRVVFWYTSATEQQLYNTYGSTELEFYVDGQVVTGNWGSYIDPTAYPPECNTSIWSTNFENNNPSKVIEMAGNKSKTVTYEVFDYNGDVVFSGTQTLIVNLCNAIELKF